MGVRESGSVLRHWLPAALENSSLDLRTLTYMQRHGRLLCKKGNDSVNVCRMHGLMDGKKEGRKERTNEQGFEEYIRNKKNLPSTGRFADKEQVVF